MPEYKILLLAEHDNCILNDSTANVVTAAKQLSGEITILVAGDECHAVAQMAAQLQDVDKVILVEAPHYKHGLAENIAILIKTLYEKNQGYDYILAPASTYGKNILPRLAAMLGVSQISEITTIISDDTFVRPTYAGNILETVKSLDLTKVITVRSTHFQKTKKHTHAAAIETFKALENPKLSSCLRQAKRENVRPELSSARIVVAGGRGLQSKESFKLLEDIADQLGAAIGASRAAVDAGFVPNDYQVGQTGKIVAPELYIAIGISGAIQHIAGMKDSKFIVAINQDPEAAIFQLSDYYLVGDLFEILPLLKNELQN